MLVAVAAIRIKHNPTAINRRQADQGLTTFERDKQAIVTTPKDQAGKASGGGASGCDNSHLIPLAPGKQFVCGWAWRPVCLEGVTSAQGELLL